MDAASYQAAQIELREWFTIKNPAVTRPTAIRSHNLFDSMETGRVWGFTEIDDKKEHIRVSELHYDPAKAIPRAEVQVFCVEHDWGAILADALSSGSFGFRTPFPYCAVEFQLGGKHICVVLVPEWDHRAPLAAYVQMRSGDWVCFNGGMALLLSPPGWEGVFDLFKWRITNTVTGAFIAIESEIAETETFRQPTALQKARERRGQCPLYSYHVIKLAGRHRCINPITDATSEKRASPRLHIRRGYWMHFATHRTWVRSTYVGNPDLGFIDKHYRV